MGRGMGYRREFLEASDNSLLPDLYSSQARDGAKSTRTKSLD